VRDSLLVFGEEPLSVTIYRDLGEDSAAPTAVLMSRLSHSREFFALAKVLNCEVFVTGGTVEGVNLNSVWSYSLATNSWHES